MSLWNASVGGLVDDTESWPDSLQTLMRDFTYERLTPLNNDGQGIGQVRDTDWYVRLARARQLRFVPAVPAARSDPGVLRTRPEGAHDPGRRARVATQADAVVVSGAVGPLRTALDHPLRLWPWRVLCVAVGASLSLDRCHVRAAQGQAVVRLPLVQHRHAAPWHPTQQQAQGTTGLATALLPRSPARRLCTVTSRRGWLDGADRPASAIVAALRRYSTRSQSVDSQTVRGRRTDIRASSAVLRQAWSFQKAVIRRLTSEARSICTM